MEKLMLSRNSSSTAIAVLDANFAWTRSLIEPMASSCQLFFLMPKDAVTAKQSGWRISTAFRQFELEQNIKSKRYIFPSGWFSRLPRPFMRYLALEVNRWFRKTTVKHRAVIASFPQYVGVFEHLDENVKKIYYCSEDFSNYWPDRLEYIRSLEERIIKLSDLTICAAAYKSKSLKLDVPESDHKIKFLLHGGVIPDTIDVKVPDDITKMKRSIIGHWGNLGPITDFELLHKIVKSFPDSSIVCVGDVAKNISVSDRLLFQQCLDCHNFHFLGQRPYADIASYVSHFDVALVLYRQEHPVTRNLNPSKVRDYLAIGRPIVSTFIPDVADIWPDLIYTRNTHDAFIKQVNELISSGGDGLNNERRDWAKAHNWQRAADELLGLITSLD